MQEFSFYIFTSILPNFEPKGGNLDYTCRVICACCDQILRFFNFGGHFYYSNFSSWSNESALRFFDFALFHVFFQVLSLFVTFRHFFNTKPCKNQTLQFSPISMTPGTWNLEKIGCFNFLQFSWPRPDTWNLAKIRLFNFI